MDLAVLGEHGAQRHHHGAEHTEAEAYPCADGVALRLLELPLLEGLPCRVARHDGGLTLSSAGAHTGSVRSVPVGDSGKLLPLWRKRRARNNRSKKSDANKRIVRPISGPSTDLLNSQGSFVEALKLIQPTIINVGLLLDDS